MNLKNLVRKNILALEPYRCARDDYNTGVLLDANENTHGPSLIQLAEEELDQELNRYPDPHQIKLKTLICEMRNQEFKDQSVPELIAENLYIGVGSDECIDSVIRIVCVPGKDKILICPPTYGMYTVCAQINDIGIVSMEQEWTDKDHFQINTDKVVEQLSKDSSIKVIFLCSPGNPTASLVDRTAIQKVLESNWNGLVVVDEAYIDFSPACSSWAPMVNKYENLVVLQTMSKSFGLAGARLGYAFTSPFLAKMFNSMKAPYNVSTPASSIALRAFSTEGIDVMRSNVTKILVQRRRLLDLLPKSPGIGQSIGGENANFLLIQVLDKPEGKPCSITAKKVYLELAEKKNVVVRYRGNEPKCTGCLRISIGTEEENDILMGQLAEVLKTAYGE